MVQNRQRGGRDDRRGRGRGGRDDRGDDFTEKVVAINRVAKVVKGGRRFSFTSLVVVGDGNGRVGFGLGRANEVPEAIRKAATIARRNVVQVPLRNGTLPHPITTDFGAARVMLKPAGPGTGVIAGGGIRAVMEAAGVRNVLTKSLGSNNVINVVRATMKAVQELRDPRQVRRERLILAGKIKPEPEPVAVPVEAEPAAADTTEAAPTTAAPAATAPTTAAPAATAPATAAPAATAPTTTAPATAAPTTTAPTTTAPTTTAPTTAAPATTAPTTAAPTTTAPATAAPTTTAPAADTPAAEAPAADADTTDAAATTEADTTDAAATTEADTGDGDAATTDAATETTPDAPAADAAAPASE